MQDLGIGATGEGSDGGVTGSAAGSTPSFKQDVVGARARVSRFGCNCHAQTMYGNKPSNSTTAVARMMLPDTRAENQKYGACHLVRQCELEDGRPRRYGAGQHAG
jgi:hypothetical protein